MFTPKPARWISVFIAASLFLTGLMPFSISAQDRKPVIVSFGQPNIWSLEQAHYLLARMHMTNLDLQAKALKADDLDPNIMHGTRIQILKQLLDIRAEFDQGVGFQNQRIVENTRFNDARRRELLTRRDSRRDESVALTREISGLEVERARMDTDKSATDADKALKDTEIKKKKEERDVLNQEVTQDNDELKTLAEPSGTPVSPSVSATPGQLPSSALDKLVEKNAEKLMDAASDPKLNASTMLDNTVQLQYEIIAKQLTLLRDEVGPGERLVFLELPQSIYTTPGSGDEKMAQTWWHVNGYTRTDPLVRLLLELLEVEQKWAAIQKVDAYTVREKKFKDIPCKVDENLDQAEREKKEKEAKEAVKALDSIAKGFFGLKCERENARDSVLRNLYREANSLFSRVEQNGARDTSELVDAIRKVVAVRNNTVPGHRGRNTVQFEVNTRGMAGNQPLASTPSESMENARSTDIQTLKNNLLQLLSENDPMNPTKEVTKRILNTLKDAGIDKSIEFIRLDEGVTRAEDVEANIERRTVRAVDIIPRQSSLNVNDIQETVKATGILAAFKFLFGFAGQVNFQRQREQFEQFVHQELYASGFGKGNRDFGWTFGALPGTKRVAPGVRTTYAALVVPEDAESILLSARGCYFPTKSYQPLDFEDTGHTDWINSRRVRQYNCGDEQSYILPIPGGGDTSNFWVTNVDYEDGKKGGDFVTVSVRGNNFSSQMGVLIDGVPLATTVGLAQPQFMPTRPGANGAEPQAVTPDCSSVTGICGSYERIDSEQLVFSFKTPANYVGTPTITLIAPGKSVDLNTIPVRINRTPNITLRKDAPFMFGARPAEVFSITDLQLFNLPSGLGQRALLVGTKFDDSKDIIYVNGVRLAKRTFIKPNVYELTFPASRLATITITIVQDDKVITKTIPNPAALPTLNPTVIDYHPAANNKPAVLVVKIEGVPAGIRVRDITGATLARLIVSATGITLRLLNPEPPVAIRLEDPITGVTTVAVVEKLPAKEEEPAPKTKPTPKKE